MSQDESRSSVLPLARELRSSSSTRTAVMQGKNVSYIKGNKLAAFLQQEKKFSPEQTAQFASALIKTKLVVKADMLDPKKKTLRPSASAASVEFDEKCFYVWSFEGSTGMRNLLLVVIVLAFFGLVLFPVWPQQAKVGVWYVSMTLLLVLFGFIVLRLVLFLVLFAVGVDFWVLPNFFADDLGVVESFRPAYTFACSVENIKQTFVYRLAVVGLLCSAAVWVYTQPTEFDEFMAQQRQFVDELYEGTLLSDKSQRDKDQIDRLTGGAHAAIPAAEQVQKELDELEQLEQQQEQEQEQQGQSEEDQAIDKLVEQEGEEEADL